MPFKLVIRHSIGQESDEFAGADVRHFHDADVSVGVSASCTCVIDDPNEFEDCHFHVRFDENGGYLLVPVEGATLFHNQRPVHAPLSLTSGDEIRVGHWTFRFQKEYSAARAGRRADVVGFVAKAIIVVVLVCELFFVYWLPRRIQSEKLLAADISRQQTVMLLDKIRRQARRSDIAEMSDHQRYALALLLDEMDRMALFVREHEKQLTDDQWSWLFDATRKTGGALRNVRNGETEHPLPEAELGQGIQAILENTGTTRQ